MSKKKCANAKEKEYMNKVAEMGCVICGSDTPATIHHCGTYMGGGRDHFKVIGLCWEHHLGEEGIDGKKMSKRQWESKYGSEEMLLSRVMTRLRIWEETGHEMLI